MAPAGCFCAGARPPSGQSCGPPHPWPVSPLPVLVNEDWTMAHVRAEDSAKLAYLEERNVSIDLRHPLATMSVTWGLGREADSHVFGRVDPHFGRRG